MVIKRGFLVFYLFYLKNKIMLRIFGILFLFCFSVYELIFGERDYDKELEKDFEDIYKYH